MNDLKQVNIELRLEQPSDFRVTENMIREAFWNHYSPGCDEHYLLHIMRDCSAFLPELDVVAVNERRIIGNVIYAKAVITGDDGLEYEVLGIGPLAVLPEYQGMGVGTKLLAYTKKLALDMGYRAIFLYGDPEYYSWHGFVPAEKYGIRTADNMYAVALQVCELYENALSGITGRYLEDEIYEIDECAAVEFDKLFPEKEYVRDTPSQKRFQQLVGMRRQIEV